MVCVRAGNRGRRRDFTNNGRTEKTKNFKGLRLAEVFRLSGLGWLGLRKALWVVSGRQTGRNRGNGGKNADLWFNKIRAVPQEIMRRDGGLRVFGRAISFIRIGAFRAER